MRGRTDEAITVHGRADHRDIAGERSGDEDRRSLPQTRDLGGDILQLEGKFGGLDVSEAKRLRALEEENAKLKRLLADSMLDQAALKELLSKKW